MNCDEVLELKLSVEMVMLIVKVGDYFLDVQRVPAQLGNRGPSNDLHAQAGHRSDKPAGSDVHNAFMATQAVIFI